MASTWPEKFANIADTISYSFSLKGMEAQFEQAFRVPLSIGVGADYAHDHLGYGVSPRDPGSIRIRTLAVESSAALLETEVAEAKADCFRIGLGYLYRLGTDGSTRRRCLARLRSMPSVTINIDFQFGVTPLIFDFVQLSDWMATSATAGSQTITADPTLVTVTNPGDLSVKSGIVMTLTALAADGFANPAILNATTGQRIETTRDSDVIGSVWRVGEPDYAVAYNQRPALVVGMAGRHVGHSAVGPANYANDYSLAALTNGFITLEPGANSLYIFGASNATFAYSFYPAYT